MIKKLTTGKRSPEKREKSNGKSPATGSWLDGRVTLYDSVDTASRVGDYAIGELLTRMQIEPVKHQPLVQELKQQMLKEPDNRAIKNKYESLKKNTQCFTLSGICPNGRSDKALADYNGKIQVDLDDIRDPKEREHILALLKTSPHVAAAWHSLSGVGVKAIVLGPPDKTLHRRSFRYVQRLMKELTGHKIDPTCANESKLVFLSYDRTLWINPEAVPFELNGAEEAPKPEPTQPLSKSKLERVKAGIETNLVGLGQITWAISKEGKNVGYAKICPSGKQHTTPRHVIIYLDGVPPHVSCFSGECTKSEGMARCNKQLQAISTEIFYEHARKQYWIREKADPDKWMTVTGGGARAELREQGVVKKACDDWLHQVRGWNNVQYAAPLAGYGSGVYNMFNEKILVTRSPKIFEPKRGQWPVLRKLLQGMFNNEQRDVVLGWTLVADEALRSGDPRHGQALGLVGPAKAGKSLLQALITVILGGRVRHPFKYMTGRTDFNAELFEAEHLSIDDEKSSIDIRSRRELGTAIKMVCVNQEQTCFRKYATPVVLKPFWRLTISVNDDIEALQVLPPLDDDISDKLILLRVTKNPMPMPTRSGAERKRFWDTLVSELPAFLYYLTREWTIPAKLRESEWAERYGIDSYKHPEVVRALNELSPEWQLAQWINQTYFPKFDNEDEEKPLSYDKDMVLEVTLNELEHDLREEHTNPVIDKFLGGHPQKLQKYLGRLAKNPSCGARIGKPTSHHVRKWTLRPPDVLPEPKPEDPM